MPDARLGEVIESSTTRFVAEAETLHRGPAFGSFVAVGEPGMPRIVAVTSDVTTASLDPGRRPLARGQPPDRYDGRIYDAFPELRETLRTEFTALVVGFRTEDGHFEQALPSHPAPLHYSVDACSREDVYAFTARFDFLRTVVTTRDAPTDELLCAVVREAAVLRGGAADAYLLAAGHALARLLKEEYDRLVAILRRISPVEVRLDVGLNGHGR